MSFTKCNLITRPVTKAKMSLYLPTGLLARGLCVHIFIDCFLLTTSTATRFKWAFIISQTTDGFQDYYSSRVFFLVFRIAVLYLLLSLSLFSENKSLPEAFVAGAGGRMGSRHSWLGLNDETQWVLLSTYSATRQGQLLLNWLGTLGCMRPHGSLCYKHTKTFLHSESSPTPINRSQH